jgi:hypothetical protein
MDKIKIIEDLQARLQAVVDFTIENCGEVWELQDKGWEESDKDSIEFVLDHIHTAQWEIAHFIGILNQPLIDISASVADKLHKLSREELINLPIGHVGDKIVCEFCAETHEIELYEHTMFYRCGEKNWMAGIEGKLYPGIKLKN